MPRLLFLPMFLVISTASIQAQAERYELGRRLRQFEETWNITASDEKKKAALADLPKLTQQFFSFQFGEAGRTLDVARGLLTKPVSSPELRFAESLYVVPGSRLIDAGQDRLRITIKPFYTVQSEKSPELQLSWWWKNSPTPDQTISLKKFPEKLEIPLPKDEADAIDDIVRIRIGVSKTEGIDSQLMISRVRNLAARLTELKKPVELPALEAATLKDRLELLNDLAEGTTAETDLPAARLLLEAEAIRHHGNKPYLDFTKPGQFWLSIPTDTKKRVASRLFVPKGLAQDRPVPIVVALHGAGGSENLFFEGYGAGQVVKECEQRGWLLLATRSGLGFGAAPPLPTLLDQLAPRYPIDRSRVFVVGHSMGAGQAIAAMQEYPGQFKAVAALGGGGAIRKKEAVSKVPVFVGVGTKDFALSGARSLSKSAQAAGAEVVFKEYPEVEHLVIVREALPDVFKQWDRLAAK